MTDHASMVIMPPLVEHIRTTAANVMLTHPRGMIGSMKTSPQDESIRLSAQKPRLPL